MAFQKQIEPCNLDCQNTMSDR